MKKLLFLLPLLFVACTAKQNIIYKINDVDVPENAITIPAKVDIRILEDNRANIEENNVLFENPRQIRLNKKQKGINSEKHYKKDPVVNQITKIMVEHFNVARLFESSFYDESENSDYYLTGTLNSFYAEQDFSTGAAIGSSFGLIGALATAGVKTPGIIIIDISDLKLYKKDGTLIKDFGSFYKEYNNDFAADGYCWCAYWNANEMLKDFNANLIEKIRHDMAEIAL